MKSGTRHNNINPRCVAETYSDYGRQNGFIPRKGKEEEFERLSAELYDADAGLKLLVPYDPDHLYDEVVAIRNKVLEDLRAVSKSTKRSLKA